MKITEILVESHELEEGPLLNKFGSAMGKVAGTVAKGVGAVAGGVAGAGTAMKKGWDAGKAAVARAGDDEPETAAGSAEVPTTATDINKAGPANTAQAKPLQGQAKMAADKTAAATADQNPDAAGQTMYAQVKANIGKLDKKGKQRILQLLQKSIAAPVAKTAPAPTTAPAPEAPAATPTAQPDELGRVEPTMAPEPAPQTTTKKRAPRKTAAPTTAPTDPAATQTAPVAEPKKRAPRKQTAKAPSQAEIDADRQRIMGVTSDSIVRRQPMMAEGFSLFRKRA